MNNPKYVTNETYIDNNRKDTYPKEKAYDPVKIEINDYLVSLIKNPHICTALYIDSEFCITTKKLIEHGVQEENLTCVNWWSDIVYKDFSKFPKLKFSII